MEQLDFISATTGLPPCCW